MQSSAGRQKHVTHVWSVVRKVGQGDDFIYIYRDFRYQLIKILAANAIHPSYVYPRLGY